MPCDADCATASTATASSLVVAFSGSGLVYPATLKAVGVVWYPPSLSGTGSSAMARAGATATRAAASAIRAIHRVWRLSRVGFAIVFLLSQVSVLRGGGPTRGTPRARPLPRSAHPPFASTACPTSLQRRRQSA